MAGWSFGIGRLFGVALRVHASLAVLLVGAMMWASYLDRPVARGVMLWLLVVGAVLVRETGRVLASLWLGLPLRGLLFTPLGAVPAWQSAETARRAAEPRTERILIAVGLGASLLAGLTLLGLVKAVAPAVDLGSQPLITPVHLLRALVWAHLLLLALHCVPAPPLDLYRLLTGVLRTLTPERADGPRRVLARVGPALPLGVIAYGLVSGNGWSFAMGLAVLLGARLDRAGVALEAGADAVRVGDVMLTEFSVLSASATLEDAVEHARHSLQDMFPVVRGGSMVGGVARQTVFEALGSGGNGYVQGIMARSFHTARPGQSLAAVLGELPAGAIQLIPVLEAEGGDRVVGLITPEHLNRSMGLPARRARTTRGGTAA